MALLFHDLQGREILLERFDLLLLAPLLLRQISDVVYR